MEETNNKSTICRACLKRSSEYIDMNSPLMARRNNKIDEKSPTYLECFKVCTQLDIEDEQTMHLCSPCSNELLAAYRFIAKARNSHEVGVGKKVNAFLKLDDTNESDKHNNFQEIRITKEAKIEREAYDSISERNVKFTNESLINKGNSHDHIEKYDDDIYKEKIDENSQQSDTDAELNSNSKHQSLIKPNHDKIKKELNYSETNHNLIKEVSQTNAVDIFVKEKMEELNSNSYTQSLAELKNVKKIKHELVDDFQLENNDNWTAEVIKKSSINSEHYIEEDCDNIFVIKEIHENYHHSDEGFDCNTFTQSVPSLKHVKEEENLVTCQEPYPSLISTTSYTTEIQKPEQDFQTIKYQQNKKSLSAYMRDYRARKKQESQILQSLFGQDKIEIETSYKTFTVCLKTNQKKKPLSSTDRSRNYRERIKLAKAEMGFHKKTPLSASDRARNFRARKKLAKDANINEAPSLLLKKYYEEHSKQNTTL